MSSSNEALEIIERWIDYAHANDKRQHLAQFWTVRDMLEGKLHYCQQTQHRAIEFVKKCKPGPDRDLLLGALNAARADRQLTTKN